MRVHRSALKHGVTQVDAVQLTSCPIGLAEGRRDAGSAVSPGDDILADMRGSDAVDVGFDIAPRSWVRAVLLALVVVMTATGWYEPMLWYVRDKAAAMTETLLPAFESLSNPTAPTETP